MTEFKKIDYFESFKLRYSPFHKIRCMHFCTFRPSSNQSLFDHLQNLIIEL